MPKTFEEQTFFEILDILDKAGDILLSYFKKNISYSNKTDNSPVTEADLKTNMFLCEHLSKISPNLPIVSEENNEESNIIASQTSEFWIIDPLDGTKSFIKNESTFAICVATIKNNRPEFGFIHVPYTKETFFNTEEGAFLKQKNSKTISIKTKKRTNNIHALSSERMKNNELFADYIKKFDIEKTSVISSAIKYCYIASGKAQLYPYFANTMQWDSAAGDALVHAAGGNVSDLNNNKLKYGNFSNFKNPHFIVTA